MITPVIINRLQWKAYLIFMCTNFTFVPLVYFCYPETANLTLEEIDYLFTEPGVAPRKVARRIQKERNMKGRSDVETGGVGHASGSGSGGEKESETQTQHAEREGEKVGDPEEVG